MDGPINVLNEDFHVVHHQSPGEHWTRHEMRASKHWDQYIEHRATCFRGTHAFEIFGMVVARDYDMLAKKFVDKTKTGEKKWAPSGFAGRGFKFDEDELDDEKQRAKAQRKLMESEMGLVVAESHLDDDEGPEKEVVKAPAVAAHVDADHKLALLHVIQLFFLLVLLLLQLLLLVLLLLLLLSHPIFPQVALIVLLLLQQSIWIVRL